MYYGLILNIPYIYIPILLISPLIARFFIFKVA